MKPSAKKEEADRSRYEIEHVGERCTRLAAGRGPDCFPPGGTVPCAREHDQQDRERSIGPSLVHAINLAEALGENLGFLVDSFRDPPRPAS